MVTLHHQVHAVLLHHNGGMLCQGVILQQGRSTGSGQKKWTVAGRFNEWVYWNHDTPPQAGDLPQQWMEWPLLAKQLHQQVTEDEISSLAKDRS